MNSAKASSIGNPGLRLRTWHLVAMSVLLFVLLCGMGIVGVFRLSSEATVLRQSVMTTVPGVWEKKIALRVGRLATALVRAGATFFTLPPEPRAVLAAVHGGEVGVYNLLHDPGVVNPTAILSRMDKDMARRGWERGVAVSQEHELVVIYFPRHGLSPRNAKCCLVVLQGRELVVASVRGNLEPLLKLANEHFDFKRMAPHLASR